MFRFVLKNLRDEENARDIVQEVFARMWEKAGQIDFAKSKSYLFTAAYHTMIDTIRRNGRFTSIENYEHMAFEPKNYTGIRKTLEEALAKLPPAQRAVVMLRDYEGYSYHEISEITGLSESQVKVYIYRARTALKNYLVTVDNLL